MKRSLGVMASIVASMTSAHAAPVILDFEGIAPYPFSGTVLVGQFYNGGTSSAGTSGPDYGISFTSSAKALCLNIPGTNCSNSSRGGMGDPASRFTGLTFTNAGAHPINVAAGFEGAVGFSYGAPVPTGTAAVYSGLNGTGTLLAMLTLAPNAGACSVPDSDFCPFSPVSLAFSGVAHSLVFASDGFQPPIDDIAFRNVLDRSAVPEPASWALLLTGVGLSGAALRRNRAMMRPA